MIHIDTYEAEIVEKVYSPTRDFCQVGECNKFIEVMAFKGTGACSLLHQKIINDDFDGHGWYNTSAMNLMNHIGTKARFSLADPWRVYEGEVAKATIYNDENVAMEVELDNGHRSWAIAEPELVHEDEQGAAFRMWPTKTVEVFRP